MYIEFKVNLWRDVSNHLICTLMQLKLRYLGQGLRVPIGSLSFTGYISSVSDVGGLL